MEQLHGNVFRFEDVVPPYHYDDVGRVHATDYAGLSNTPIVMDIGSFKLRAGYSSHEAPTLLFRSEVAKPRVKKTDGTVDRVANEVASEDVNRFLFRSPFDGCIIYNYDLMETLFDFCFWKLGVNGQRVEHPILLTEPLCNPSYCRSHMNELLFELYDVNSANYAISSLLSFGYNCGQQSGVVIETGHHTCTVIPVYQGNPLLSGGVRLDLGAAECKEFLQTIMRLKYPVHRQVFSDLGCEILFKNFAKVSHDYMHELENFDDEIVIQLDYPEEQKLTEEEIRKKKERRKEQGRRLRRKAEEKRKEKYMERKRAVETFEDLLVKRRDGTVSEDTFLKEIKRGGFDGKDDFLEVYNDLKRVVERHEKRRSRDSAKGSGEMSFNLLNIPDAKLTAEQLKEKRKQRLMKGAKEARERKKLEKDLKEQLHENWKKEQRDLYQKDAEGFVKNMLERRTAIVEKRNRRLKRKQDLSNRRSKAVQERMRLLAEMATETDIQEGGNDTFGVHDEDWDIYRQASLEVNMDSESEEEKQQISKLEELLEELDPSLDITSVLEADTGGKPQKRSIAKLYQVKMGVERIRIPELIFQPSLIGRREAGLSELLSIISSRLEKGERHSDIMTRVFLTGGMAHVNGLEERIRREFRRIAPYGCDFEVLTAKDPLLDAWNGACMFARSEEFAQTSITRSDYLECGSDYLKHHRFGNKYTPKVYKNKKKRL